MRVAETELPGVLLVEVERREDERGFFGRAWCRREASELGLNPDMVQANVGYSRKLGTLRGLHYQAAPHEEAKLVRCTRGAVFDVAVDVRPDSGTFGRWFGTELTEDNRSMLYVPEGFAHGYLSLTDDAEVVYQTSAFYAPEAVRGARYDDPAFAIDWPIEIAVVSEQDRSWPLTEGETR